MTAGTLKKQRGFGLGQFVVALFLLILIAPFVFKMFPHYAEYFAIQRTFKALAVDPALQSGNRREIAAAFGRYASVDNIDSISAEDIEISKDGAVLSLSAHYQVKVPLIANITLLIEFSPTSASK